MLKRLTASRTATAALAWAMASVCLFAAWDAVAASGETVITEDKLPELKAAVVFKILKFVRWSEDLYDDGVLRAGVIGTPAMVEAFAEYDGRDIGDRIFRTTEITQHDDVSGLDVLFIQEERNDEACKEWALDLSGLEGVLTVGDCNCFNDRSGIIRLRLEDGRLAFTINNDAAVSAGVFLSSRLLSIATIYVPEGDG